MTKGTCKQIPDFVHPITNRPDQAKCKEKNMHSTIRGTISEEHRFLQNATAMSVHFKKKSLTESFINKMMSKKPTKC